MYNKQILSNGENTKSAVKRARAQEEICVIEVLKDLAIKHNLDITVEQSSFEKDWQHIDIEVLINGKTKINIDVKRNSPKNIDKNKFTFTPKNSNGKMFVFKKGDRFMYIDENDPKSPTRCSIISVEQTDFQNYFKNYKLKPSLHDNNSEYIEFSKSTLRKLRSAKIIYIDKKFVDLLYNPF